MFSYIEKKDLLPVRSDLSRQVVFRDSGFSRQVSLYFASLFQRADIGGNVQQRRLAGSQQEKSVKARNDVNRRRKEKGPEIPDEFYMQYTIAGVAIE